MLTGNYEDLLMDMSMTYNQEFGILDELQQSIIISKMEQILRNNIEPFVDFKIKESKKRKPSIKKPVGFCKCRFKLWQSSGCKGCHFSNNFTYSDEFKGCIPK